MQYAPTALKINYLNLEGLADLLGFFALYGHQKTRTSVNISIFLIKYQAHPGNVCQQFLIVNLIENRQIKRVRQKQIIQF